jgi:basic amino acid/polyamine antiporter, APA family
MAEATTLKRAIALPHATAMVVGIIIGASVFVQASEITALVQSRWGVAAVWIVAGILTLCGAFVCAELASAFPRTGGVYVFLREIYSPALGFLWGWAMFWAMHTGILAAIATVFARYAAYFVPVGDAGLRAIAISAIAVLSFVNYLGVSLGSRIQTVITVMKVLAVVGIIAVGVVLMPVDVPSLERNGIIRPSGQTVMPPFIGWPAPEPITVAGFLLAVSAGLFAFGGWHMVTYTAEETQAPERTIPRALVLGIVIVTLCYVGLNALYLRVLPLQWVMRSDRVAADVFEELLGRGGGSVISAVVLISAFGALNGIILAGPRVYYSMAQDGLLFRWFAAVHPRNRTPGRAILLQGAWAAVLVLTGTYRSLFTLVIYTEWIFFALLGLGVVLLRRRPDYAPRWPMPGVPAVPMLFAAASFAIVINQIVSDPGWSAVGLAMVVSGVPVYWLWQRRAARALDHAA